ncbi:MAG: hypothetical protein LUQ65_13865 [Candidatus Helarchaeota archaeon]|nr:hypothetical protein [Candidatus Helarchaeota archaeon]
MVVISFAGVKFTRYFLKSNTYLNRLLFLAVLCFSFGFIYDFARLVCLIYFGDLNIILDKLGFCLKIFLNCVTISTLLHIFFIITRQGGAPVKYESVVRYFYYGVVGFVTIFNVYFYNVVTLDSGSIYVFQIHPLTMLITLAVYLPLFIFILFRLLKITGKIDDKSLSKLNLFLGSAILILGFERFANTSIYSPGLNFIFGTSLYGLIIDFSVVFVMSILLSYFLFFGKIDLLESTSTYFCLKTLYIIKKESGHVFYEHEFRATGDSTSALLTDRFLLGGFLYAITQGLELGLGLSGDIDIIQAGKTTILLRHGKHVFGLLFTIEYTHTLEDMIRKFMDRFEQSYASVLENWPGDLSAIKLEQLNAWTLEIFKRF